MTIYQIIEKDSARIATRLINKSIKRNGCVLWTGWVNPKGYGRMYVGKSSDGKKTMALVHRVAWMLKHGAIASGLLVCHKCDNPACIQTSHLFLGTDLENQRDSINKGRARKARGQRNGKVRLSDKDVSRIRQMRMAGLMYREISALVKTPVSTIGGICRGRTR